MAGNDMFIRSGDKGPLDGLTGAEEQSRRGRDQFGRGSEQAAEVMGSFKARDVGALDGLRGTDDAIRAATGALGGGAGGGYRDFVIDRDAGYVYIGGKSGGKLRGQAIRIEDLTDHDLSLIREGRFDPARAQALGRKVETTRIKRGGKTFDVTKDETGASMGIRQVGRGELVKERFDAKAKQVAKDVARKRLDARSRSGADQFVGASERKAQAMAQFKPIADRVDKVMKSKTMKVAGKVGRAGARAGAVGLAVGKEAAIGAARGALTADESSGLSAKGVSGVANMGFEYRRLKKAGAGRTMRATGALVAATGDEDAQKVYGGVNGAWRVSKAIGKRADEIGYRHNARAAKRAKKEVLAAKDALSSYQKGIIKRGYAQRKSREFARMMREGKVITGQGLKARVLSTVRAFASASASAVRGMLAAMFGGSMAIMLPLILGVVLAGSLFSSCTGPAGGGMNVESILAMAAKYAADDTIGYSQGTRRHNPNMDCSSFVWYCLHDSGAIPEDKIGTTVDTVPGLAVGDTFQTANMVDLLVGMGFTRIDFSRAAGPSQLQPGDILWTRGHTEIYAGGGMNYGATVDLDGRDGDSSGREVSHHAYYDDNWTIILRPPAGGGTIQIPEQYGHGGYTITAYDQFDGKWAAGTAQSRVNALWHATGAQWNEGIATINGRYLIACTSTFGKVGDMVDFYLDDGTKIPCIIADEKSQEVTPWDHDPANKWGHNDGQCVIEFEVQYSWYRRYGNPGNGAWKGEWGGKRVASATNGGSVL